MKTFLAASLRVLLVCGTIAAGLYGIRSELVKANEQLNNLGRTAEIDRDFTMRVFHYVKPHKPFEMTQQPNGMRFPLCGECVDALREAGKWHEPGLFVDEKRYEELLEIERLSQN